MKTANMELIGMHACLYLLLDQLGPFGQNLLLLGEGEGRFKDIPPYSAVLQSQLSWFEPKAHFSVPE